MGRIKKHSGLKTSRGFTLLEVLVVVILIAMGASMISIAIGGDHYEEEARKEAEQFLLTGKYLSEQAVFRGETYGAFFYPQEIDDGLIWCYLWQRVRDAQWQPLGELPERCLPYGFEVEIFIDKQPWEYDDSQEHHDPVMGFFPSGEGSASVELRIFRDGDNQHEPSEELFQLAPTGELRWVTEEERLEQNK